MKGKRIGHYGGLIVLVLIGLAACASLSLGEEISIEPTAPTPRWLVHVISKKTGGPDGVRMEDVNGDGWLDITTAYETSGNIILFLHPGPDGLDSAWPFIVVGNQPRGEDAFAIDVNLDGNVDVISAHEGDTLGLFVHWAPGKGEDYQDSNLWVSERIGVADGHAWMFAIPMDVNEDGRMDIVAGSKDDFFNDRNAIGELAWLESPTSERDTWLYHPIDHVGWPMSIEAIDMDQDGDMDILVSDRKADEEHQGVRWLENPGDNWTKEWSSHFVADLAGTRPMFLGFGDLDEDGSQELVAPLDLRNEVVVASLAVGEAATIKAIILETDLVIHEERLKAAGVTDIDLDGILEIVLSVENGDVGIGYLDSVEKSIDGLWTWVPIFDVLHNPKYDLIAFYDVDGDGDTDILSTEESQGLGVIWLENPAISRD